MIKVQKRHKMFQYNMKVLSKLYWSDGPRMVTIIVYKWSKHSEHSVNLMVICVSHVWTIQVRVTNVKCEKHIDLY